MAVARPAEDARSRPGSRLSKITGWPLWSLAEPLRSYVIGTTAIAVALTATAVISTTWRINQLLIFAGILVCGIVAIEATRSVREVHGTVARDLQSVWYLTAAITLPPAYAMLAPIPMAAYRLWRGQRGRVPKRVVSNAASSLAYCA